MEYCEASESGACAKCGITYADGKYARECRPLAYWLEQARMQEQHVAEVLAGDNAASPPTHGPGTELKKLLALIGITSAPDCACNAHAAEMDRMGGEWCAANIDTIVGWLREQATARGLPFLDAAGGMLVRRAIRNAARLAS